jgi:pyruvate,water dikinase
VTGARAADGDLSALLGFVREVARRPRTGGPAGAVKDAARLKAAFLDRFSGEERKRAAELLDLARNSYQLRDDDNIHLGRIEAQFLAAAAAGRQRLAQELPDGEKLLLEQILDQVAASDAKHDSQPDEDKRPMSFRQRQLVGQPAGPGLVKARARVVAAPGELLAFKAGEILVCDAVDPNMTFVIPLAAGIVERR